MNIEPRFAPLLAAFRDALVDCRKLYVYSGEECARDYPHLIGQSRQQYVQMMDDLHRALLVKVFVTICEADRRWSDNERLLAEVLFEHVWQRSLTGDALKEAILNVSQNSVKLKWYSLVRPFDQVAPLRDHVAELETVVLRLANIVARADRDKCAKAERHVTMVRDELDRHLRQIPIDEPSQHEAATQLGGQAIASVRQTASEVREQCKLPAESGGETEQQASQEELLQEALAELDALIGLESVKQEVRTLINFLKVQEQRAKADLPTTSLSLHMVFCGNPGTGKTSVARIVGRIFGAMGVLSKGHLVETDRAGLVAEYAGQTGPKTNKKIDEALDGVLFIDEAYSLIATEGDDAFGREAIQTLLKRMEDDRDRLVVILAGYPNEMQQLLASNPGLSSRFSRQLTFADYSPIELAKIFGRMCKSNHYVLGKLPRVKLLLGLKWMYDHRDRHFGNGRAVRNLFEQAIRRLANRVAGLSDVTREQLTQFDEADIGFAGRTPQAARAPAVPSETFSDLSNDQRTFSVTCPGCDRTTKMPQAFLNRRVKCPCGERFTAEWGEPV